MNFLNGTDFDFLNSTDFWVLILLVMIVELLRKILNRLSAIFSALDRDPEWSPTRDRDDA